MTSALSTTFEQLRSRAEKAFIPFITAGDPDLETTVRLVPEMERAGCHIVELGIPFSDPVADGPTIQRSSERALRHRYRIGDYLGAVGDIRKKSGIPVVLFSYFNPILQYGLENLARDAQAAGVDGVLITDVIPEEGEEYCACLRRHELDPVFLVAPTSSPERIGRIAACCRGFIYVVSRAGVTGARDSLSGELLPTIQRVRDRSSLPVAVGFGISSPEQVRAVWRVADGAVVGSAIVSQMEKYGSAPDLVERVAGYCRRLLGGN